MLTTFELMFLYKFRMRLSTLGSRVPGFPMHALLQGEMDDQRIKVGWFGLWRLNWRSTSIEQHHDDTMDFKANHTEVHAESELRFVFS